MLKRFLNEEWKASLDLETDKDGFISFRGFFGEYDIFVDGSDYKINYSHKKQRAF